MKKNILITGSSGYIGQHLVKLLQKEYNVFGIDKTPKVNDYLPRNNFMQINICYDIENFLFSLSNWPDEFDAVVHLAALVRVNESVEQPYTYYNTNINGTANVLHGLKYKNFIFASTGAAENPISPYALSKRVTEDIVHESCHTGNYTIFRFYNVIGTDGITQPTNPDGLFYNLIQSKDTGQFKIFGNDYNTIDGTPVRDYVHVLDICRAIQKAIELPANGLENLGTGTGYTVKEIASAFYRVNKLTCNVEYLPRRSGDAERTVLNEPSTYMINSYTLDELVKI